jgi:hypothetical protein
MAEVLTWIDPSSVSTALDGSGNYTGIVGRKGLLGVPETFVEQDIPLSPGSRLRQVKTPNTEVMVPLLVKGSGSEAALIANIRTLRSAMNPTRGDGILQYQAQDGTIRQLNCRLLQGFEGDESDGNRGPGYIVLPLVFHAFDPYWYDQTATVPVYTTFTAKTVVNAGDVEMWPQWSIHGPTTNLTITNTTTGKSMVFTLTLGNTDVLTIDARPGIKTVLLNGVTNEYSAMSATSALFSFPALTTSTLNFTLAGTTGATAITLTYKQRWIGV